MWIASRMSVVNRKLYAIRGVAVEPLATRTVLTAACIARELNAIQMIKTPAVRRRVHVTSSLQAMAFHTAILSPAAVRISDLLHRLI
jgi:hypothetical protein